MKAMKKIMTILMLMTIGLSAQAEEKLYVAGNKLNLNQTYPQEYLDGLGGGYISYYPSAKRLIVAGVDIERSGDGNNGIDSSVSGLKIEFQGINSIKTTAACLKFQANTTIENEGTVNLNCTGSNEGIYIMNTTTVEITGGTWNIKSASDYGIEGKDKNQTLVINDASYSPLFMTVNGSAGCIRDLKDLTLNNDIELCTDGTVFQSNAVRDASGNILKGVDLIIGTPVFSLGDYTWAIGQTSIKAPTITGTVTYDHSTKTLKMTNATTTAGTFQPRQDGMALVCSGTNTLYKTGSAEKSIDLTSSNDGSLTIRGTGTLNSGSILLKNSNSKLTISGGVKVNVQTEGADGIITDLADLFGTVEVNSSSLSVTEHEAYIGAWVKMNGSVISSINTLFLTDVKGVPQYNTGEKGLLYGKGEHKIVPGTAYELWVCDRQVNSFNCSQLSPLFISGTCTYTPSTKTLTFNNATTLYPTMSVSNNGIDGLKIVSTGTNTLRGPILSAYDFSISGSGHLKVVGGEADAIQILNKKLTINNTEVTVSGKTAIQGEFDPFVDVSLWSRVDVNNSKLHLSGTKQAIDVALFDPEDNCFVITPSDGVKQGGTIYEANGTPAKTVELRPMTKYNLWINGKQVNEVNCNSLISSDAGYSGTMQFIPSTNTLNLNGVGTDMNFNGGNTYIKSTLPTLNINLQDKSYLFGRSSDEGLYATGNVKIGGDGFLNFNGQKKAVYVGGLLELTDNAEVKALGTEYGVSTRKLTMSANTKLSTRANPSNQGKSLIIDNTPTFNGVALPSDMRYDSSQKCVVDRTTGAPVSVMVKINADNAVGLVTDINVVSTEQATETTVYSTSGQLLWQGKGQPQLPRGIYVVKQGGQARKVQF